MTVVHWAPSQWSMTSFGQFISVIEPIAHTSAVARTEILRNHLFDPAKPAFLSVQELPSYWKARLSATTHPLVGESISISVQLRPRKPGGSTACQAPS